MQNQPACPTCGRVYEAAKPLRGRVCYKCATFKEYAAFKTKRGKICFDCREQGKRDTEKRRAGYFQKYYFRVVKPKRLRNSPVAKTKARLNAISDIFGERGTIMDYRYKDPGLERLPLED